MNDTTPQSPATASTTVKRRKWLIVTALTLAVLTLLTVTLLPVGIQYGLRNWLLENGAHNVRIADVDLNPFTGILQLEDISIDVDEHNTLSAKLINLNFAWQALAKKRFTLTAVHVSGIDIEIRQSNNGELHIGGILIPATGTQTADDLGKLEQEIEASSHWGIGIDELDFADIGIHYSMPKLEIDTRIEQLSLRQLASWRPGKGAQISLQATINGAPLKYNGSVAPFAEALHVDGNIDLRELALDNFKQITAVSDELSGKLSLQSNFDLSLADTGIKAQVKAGEIQLDELLFSTADIRLQQKSLNWKGDIDFQQTGKLHLTAAGTIASQQLAASLPAQKLDIAQQDLKTAVNIEFTSSDKNSPPGIVALLNKTEISQLYVNANAFPLAGLEQITINKLELRDPGSLDIQQIQLAKLYVAKASVEKPETDTASPALFNNGSLTINDLSLKDTNTLSIKNIFLKDADIYFSRASDGSSNIDSLLAAIESIGGQNETAAKTATSASSEPPAEKEKTNDKPTTFHISHIQISDDSTIVVEDAGTTPMTRVNISIENLSVDNLDNSPANEVTKLQAKGKFGRFGSYTISGEVQPFSTKANGKLIADIKGIDLPNLSPYTERELDFRLGSGTLASDMDITIKEDQLSGKTQLTLQQLELIPIEQPQQQEQQHGGMTAASLNTSLNMLRDKNNTITLDIPLSGDINAPDFSIQNVLNQALMSGVKTGVMTYALLALQPYGTMVVLAKYAGDQVSKLRLDPVQFSPGSSEISDTGKDYLTKVAGILIDRPKVAIKVCGVAMASDASALLQESKQKKPLSEEESRKQLKQLAQQRSIAVREFLISKASDSSTQLISCMPTVESDDAQARADLLI